MGSTARRRIGDAANTTGRVPDARPGPTIPDPPAWLGDDATKVWTRLAPVVPKGKLTTETADAFALLCVALATYAEAHGIITDTGLLIAQGQELVINPAYAIRMQQNPVALNLLKTFGLTPDQPTAARPAGHRPHLVE